MLIDRYEFVNSEAIDDPTGGKWETTNCRISARETLDWNSEL
jgi:hypothetical protein